MPKFKLTLIIFFSLFASLTKAASFDCKTAKLNIEKLICSKPEISRFDEDLSKSYIDIKSKAENPELLIFSQKRWLKSRNKCKDELCLKNEYKSRIEELSTWLKNEVPNTSGEHQLAFVYADFEDTSDAFNKKHRELLKLASPDIADTIEKYQKSWEIYISNKCDLYVDVDIYGPAGAWASIRRTDCNHGAFRKRLHNVESALQCIKKLPPENRGIVVQSECLNLLISDTDTDIFYTS